MFDTLPCPLPGSPGLSPCCRSVRPSVVPRRVRGRPGLLYVPRDFAAGVLRQAGGEVGRGRGHAGPGVGADGHVSATRSHRPGGETCRRAAVCSRSWSYRRRLAASRFRCWSSCRAARPLPALQRLVTIRASREEGSSVFLFLFFSRCGGVIGGGTRDLLLVVVPRAGAASWPGAGLTVTPLWRVL